MPFDFDPLPPPAPAAAPAPAAPSLATLAPVVHAGRGPCCIHHSLCAVHAAPHDGLAATCTCSRGGVHQRHARVLPETMFFAPRELQALVAAAS